MDSQAFDFYAAHVHRGDRFYFQVPVGLRVNTNLLGSAVAGASFYLLPGVRTTDLRDATVVVSYQANPSRLGLRYVSRFRDGRRPYFVSRVARR